MIKDKKIVDLIVREVGYFLEYLEARVEAAGIPEEYEDAFYGLLAKKILSGVYYAKNEEQVEKVTRHLINGILEELEEWKALDQAQEDEDE